MNRKLQPDFLTQASKIMHFSFDNLDDFERYGKNWSFYCKYRFGNGEFTGKYDIYQDKDFQIARSFYRDGMMYNGHPPKGTVNLVIVLSKEGSLCINKKKMNTNDVLILDDQDEYEIIFSHGIHIGVISMQLSFVDENLPFLNQKYNQVFKDHQEGIREICYLNFQDVSSAEIKNKLISLTKRSLMLNRALVKSLTTNEELAFEIRNQILQDLQSCIKISSLSVDNKISERSLQNSFKKLFGITPKKFIKILKFNLVYRDLSAALNTESVTQIAMKWGFNHLGNFSKQYKEIFKESPKETKNRHENSHIEPQCLSPERITT